MKHYSIGKLALTAVTLLTLTACHDDQQVAQYDFTATLEQLQPESNGSKVYLVNESWIYWEIGDMISINCDQGAPEPTDGGIKASGYLTGASGDFENYNGSFATTLNWGAKYFLGLHPYDADNVITPVGAGNRDFSDIKIKLKAEQTYRTDEKGDLTFDKQVLPMVAWFGGEWDDSPSSTAFNLDFRSLAGLVRLQFYNKTAVAHNITSIVVTSQEASKPLSGMFNVRNYKTYDPHLEMASPTSPTVTLTMPDGGLPFAAGDLKSFYLVLPAIHGRDVPDSYSLSVTVNTDAGSFTKNVTVPLRRNGITYLRAIGITNWDATPTVEPGLVGNGTQSRPFKIYTYSELVYLRNCFNNPEAGVVKVNGQEVTNDTYFRIMRNDINLTTTGSTPWNVGIQGFKGKLTYAANESADNNVTSTPGITNNSAHPLFESIAANATVSGLTIRCDSTIRYTSEGGFSPLCGTNNGTIENCNIITPTTNGRTIEFYGTSSAGSSTCFAGLCVTNSSTGIIRGSGCTVRGSFNRGISTSTAQFAGICMINNGTIQGCYASSDMSVGGSAAQAAGICLTNNKDVKDCYYAARINNTGATSWGAIVYQNNNASATIDNCYSGDGGLLSSTDANCSIGGIVCLNTNGIVNNCRSYVQLRAAKVGGIAVTMNNGTIKNCYINDSIFVLSLNASSSAHYAGGLVAEMSGGTLFNSFALINRVTTHDLSGVYGSVVGHLTGGTINNCYGLSVTSISTKFYGDKSGSPTLSYCYLVDNNQADVTHVDANNAGLGGLLDNLNTHNNDGYSWTRGTLSGNDTDDKRAPSLVMPSSAKKRNRR